MLEQVSNLGGELVFDECVKVSPGDVITVNLKDSGDILCKSLILATGSVHRRLNVEHEEELIGKHVHFCAVCDAGLYKDKTVVLVGGGNSALVEADILANICKKVIILQNLSEFTGEASLIKQLESHDNITTYFNCSNIKYIVEDSFKGVSFNGEEILCDGVFLAIGLVPDNKYFKDLLDLDDRGYFISDENGYTKYDNIFVAGDCRQKKLRQVVTACGDGANCAINASRYLRGVK